MQKDRFNIPILPTDWIIEKNGKLNAKIFLFTDITPGKEKYCEIEFKEVQKNKVLPDFTYLKPDPQEKDPRNLKNIKYVDEQKLGKVRSNYILLAVLPDTNGIQYFGMRNHLHKPITKNHPGIICAVWEDKWTVRNYFELDNIMFSDNMKSQDVIKLINK